MCSGINDGANLCDDALYSGTIAAAAIEGRFLGLPAVAFSLCMEPDSQRNFDTAAKVAETLVGRLMQQPLERGVTLNVNVPDLPYDEIKGIRATRLGGRPSLQAHRPRAGHEGSAHVLDRPFGRRPGCRRGQPTSMPSPMATFP